MHFHLGDFVKIDFLVLKDFCVWTCVGNYSDTELSVFYNLVTKSDVF
jgi:hypothetical protein